MLPQAQRQGRILFRVRAHEVSGQLVHLGLRIEAHLLCSLAQLALVLALLQVVKPEVVERVAEAVLIQQRSGDHGVYDTALDLDALGPHPAHVVHGVVEYVGAVRV